MLVYLSLEALHDICSSKFIPPSSHSRAVESSNSVSLATSLNSFQYSVIDFRPCFMFLSVILASPLASMTPNWLLSSCTNPAQFSHVDGISSSVYGVIPLPVSSLNRLIVYRIFSSSCPSAHWIALKYTWCWASHPRSLCRFALYVSGSLIFGFLVPPLRDWMIYCS